MNLKPTLRGSRFVHVGIDVKLHPVRFINSGYRHPQLHWNAREEPLRAYWRALRNNVFLKTPLPWRIKYFHSIPEYRKRLARADLKAKVDGPSRWYRRRSKTLTPFLHSTLDEAYEHLVYTTDKGTTKQKQNKL